MSDYYQTLGVDRNASQDDIKRAYRSLASKHHPDKGGDTVKFQEIQAAYATLSDPQKKEEYDNPRPQGFHGHSGPTGFPPGFEDIFGQMFGNHNPFGFGQRQPQQNRTLNIQTSISLEDAFYGKDLIANLGLPSGREQTIEIKIPAGIQEGVVLRLAGMGDDSIPGIPRGDIHLTVNIIPHSKFQRRGDDLICTSEISCIEAMLGKNILIDTIDGKTLELSVHPGIQNGQSLAAANYGMPKMNDNRFRGRLIVTINISIPTNLTSEQKELLKQFNTIK
jgi:DnaJ-class molecular chaperone